MLANLVLDIDEIGDLDEEPRIDASHFGNVSERITMTQSVGDVQDPVRAGNPQLLAQTVAVQVSGDRATNLVETGDAGLEPAQRFLQRLLEISADGHDFANRLHLRREAVVRPGELLEGEPGNLGNDIVDRRFERGRRQATRDVVLQLVQRVPDGKLGRHLGNRETGRLGCQCRGTRHARIHLDDEHTPCVRADRKLHVGAARLDADLAQYVDRRVA